MAMYRHLEKGTLCSHISVVLSMHCFTMHATRHDVKDVSDDRYKNLSRRRTSDQL